MSKYKNVNRKRDQRMIIRLTENEKKEVYKVAKENGMNATEFLLYATKLVKEKNNNGLHSE